MDETQISTNVTESREADELNTADELVAAIGFAEAETLNVLIEKIPESYTPQCNVFPNTTPNNKPKITSDQFCSKVSNRLASVSMSSCKSAKLEYSGCHSIDGIPLMVREFPPMPRRQPLGRILLIGGTHGDELTSVSVVFRWIEKLNKHHSGLFHWHVIPVLNPDGLLKRSAERTNQNGVDINRNLPSDDWEKNALAYWQSKGGSDPRKFPGKVPNSEPETHWLVDEIELFRPDAIIAVHAPYGVVDFDSQVLNTAPKSLGKLRLNLLGTYPGSLGNYAGINKNIPVITLELPHAWEMPSENESDLIWIDIVSWLKKHLQNQTTSPALAE